MRWQLICSFNVLLLSFVIKLDKRKRQLFGMLGIFDRSTQIPLEAIKSVWQCDQDATISLLQDLRRCGLLDLNEADW